MAEDKAVEVPVAKAEGVEISDEGSNSEDDYLFKKVHKNAMTYEQSVHHHEQFHMREVVYDLPGGGQMRFNPFASLFAIVILWGIAIWCIVDPPGASASLGNAMSEVSSLFSWFYVGTNPAFMVR